MTSANFTDLINSPAQTNPPGPSNTPYSSLHDTISKQKINKLVLNYFIQEGFQEAALSFSREVGIDLDPKSAQALPKPCDSLRFVLQIPAEPVDFVLAIKRFAESKSPAELDHIESKAGSDMARGYSLIEKRKRIKYLILKGDITQAIHVISTHFPTVLDSNNLLLFKLLRLNLIEMIREHKLEQDELVKKEADAERKFLDNILLFVREKLISKVTHSHELLKELEMTMSLLCFNFNPRKPTEELNDLPEELRQLFDLSLRNECYRVVNRIILDLDSTDSDIQAYKGLPYADFSPAMLLKLPPAPTLEGQDVKMEDALEPPKLDMLDWIEVDSHPSDSPTDQKDDPVIEHSTLESKLERIAMLWIATEQRLVDKKIIPAKRYGQQTGPKVL